MMKILKTPKTNQESGVVSLIVVSVLAVVLGLIAVGFAQLTNRELRQASDRELSTQAFYSAESGLNDAIAYLQAGGTVPLNGCSDWHNTPLGPQFFADTLTGTSKYTCVIINGDSPSLLYHLQAGQSVTVKLDNATVPAMNKLFFGWENQGQTNSGSPLGGLGSLPQESSGIFGNPATTGLLRVGVYAVPNSLTSADNNMLATLSRSYFMYPNGGGGGAAAVDFGSGSYNPAGGPGGTNGEFVPGNCKSGNSNPVGNANVAARYCNTQLTGISSSGNTYYIRLTAVYTALNVTLQAENGGGSALNFNNIQGVIDITGQGTDVLQRISARIDLSKKYQQPDFAIQSMEAICKGFGVEVDGPSQYGSNITNMLNNPDGACSQPPDAGGSAPGAGGDLGPH